MERCPRNAVEPSRSARFQRPDHGLLCDRRSSVRAAVLPPPAPANNGVWDSVPSPPRATEVWEIHNFTADAHPIRIHEVEFEIVGRENAVGVVRPPEAWETGAKDTVISYPGEITRVKATFDRARAGQFVWHCHILEHEDNEMMRPYSVGPIQNPTQ